MEKHLSLHALRMQLALILGQRDTNGAIIRCIDVLHALYTLLQRRIKEHEYWALEKSRRVRVSEVFWERCTATTAGKEDPNTEARFGVRRMDLLDGWR